LISLAATSTALVLIDLQKGIVDLPVAPHSGADVVSRAKAAAARFRSAGATVILVNVAFAEDWSDALKAPVDQPMQRPPSGFPPGWTALVDGLAQPSDLTITKRQWGAFYGTDLDLQLRRRGITSIVLGGIATNMGVESTARDAQARGYALVFAEDAMTTMTAEMHEFATATMFPILGRVRSTEEILASLA
jgi:nicotinamidase-related amidase